MPTSNRSKNQPNQVATRTRVTIWAAIVFSAAYAIALATSPAWESTAPQWVMLPDHRAGLLALLAATFVLLSIVVPSQAMPKAFLITKLVGSLTGYAAVINAFDPISIEVGIAIVLAVLPIFVLWTSTWRMPKGWEWAGWFAIGSTAILAIVTITINTPLAALLVAILGEGTTFAILASATVISAPVLFATIIAFAVKAVGMARAPFTAKFINAQASKSK